MSKADEELFGLKSSRTGEYLHSKSADELFYNLGYKKEEDNYTIKYKHKIYPQYIAFDFDCKMVCTYGEDDQAVYIEMDELQAINLKVKELRLDRRRR